MRLVPDVLKMGEAMRQPGIDPRVWATGARVIDDDNTARWDADLGWVIDVRAYGSGLEGEEIQARVAHPSPYEFLPPEAGCEAVVVVPDGEVDGIPSAVGFMNNASGCEAPGEIHGLSIDGSDGVSSAAFDASSGFISPYDTEFKASPFSRRVQFEGYYFVKASDCVLEGDQVRFAERDASQAFVRGDEYTSAEQQMLTLLEQAFAALSMGAVGPLSALKPGFEAAKSAVAGFSPGDHLSSRIKGE